ncbi:hypothetical protein [Devosia sp.]|uniref:hypothetical protein n=1 Tax=Devosia sp. TaxID=1871048 RepID=UPI002EF9C460
MVDLTVDTQLRPTRLALLVRPSDLSSIRRFMRVCACMWGGIYNPIIPVFPVGPKEWRKEHWRFSKGRNVAKGYVEFFEPDAFVEAEAGLLDEAGLQGVRRQYEIHSRVLPLGDLLKKQDGRNFAELSVGLSVIDVLRDIYKSERRFALRQESPAYFVKPERGSAAVEALFGAYPTGKASTYFEKGYKDVFRPEIVAAGPAAWRKVFGAGAPTPLRITRYSIEASRSWNDDLVIYVFDPKRPTDLIDLWNMRLEPNPVLPVPVGWAQDLAPDIANILKEEHRPVVGNPYGVMHHATLEFGRSLAEADIEQVVKAVRPLMPPPDADAAKKGQGPLVVKPWRNQVWVRRGDENGMQRPTRIELSVKSNRATIQVDRDSKHMIAHVDSIFPDFAERFGAHDLRWVNSIRVSTFDDEAVATVLPFNIIDRKWPRLALGGDSVMVGSEGWSVGQHYRGLGTSLDLMSPEEAIIGWLGTLGVQATASEPGYIAKQVLSHLGGLRSANIIAHAETLQTLNKMAGGIRVRTGGDEPETEEVFGRHSKSFADWKAILSRRAKERSFRETTLDHLTDSNVLRLGVETTCPHCKNSNWHSISDANYSLRCERCLKMYPFPQGNVARQWSYRAIGPFAVPDYAKGSYGAVLALHALKSMAAHMTPMTYSTALTMKFDGAIVEADYVAWIGKDTIGDLPYEYPRLVLGEAKSFGRGELIKASDVDQLKKAAAKLPGATLAVSVLRDEFTHAEKTVLTDLARWGRKLDERGEHRNPLLLLTGTELLNYYVTLERTWKDKGGEHAKFADYRFTHGLHAIAESTVAIHLGLPSFEEERWRVAEERVKHRRKRLLAKKAGQ